MTTKRPSLLRRLVKFLAFLFVLGVLILLGFVAWAVWPQAVVPAENFARLAPHGALVVRFDPADPETGSLIVDLASKGDKEVAKAMSWMATSAVHPEVVALSFYDRATGAESFAAALQLRRFGRPLVLLLDADAGDADPGVRRVADGIFTIPDDRRTADDPFVRIFRQGVVIASLDSAADRVARFLASGTADTAPRPTDRQRELYGRMLVEPGQVRGFLANDDQRLARLIRRAEEEGSITPEAAEMLTPEVRQALEEEFDGLLVAGELMPGDALELRLRLLFTSPEAAGRVEPLVAGFLIPQLAEQHPDVTFAVERERGVVTVKATIGDLRARLRRMS